VGRHSLWQLSTQSRHWQSNAYQIRFVTITTVRMIAIPKKAHFNGSQPFGATNVGSLGFSPAEANRAYFRFPRNTDVSPELVPRSSPN